MPPSGTLGEAVLSIRTDMVQFDAGLNSVSKKQDALKASFKDTGDAAKGFGREVTGLEGHLSALTIAMGAAAGTLLAHGLEKLAEGALKALEAVPNLVNSTIKLGSELLTTSLKTGISVDGLSKLRYVAAQTGTDLGGLTSAIFKMEANLGSGTKKVSDALDHIGLSMKDLKSAKPEEAFIQILERLHDMPGASERAAAGVAIFGKGFREIAQLAQEDVRGLIEEAQKLGIVMTTETAASAKAAEDAMKAFDFQLEAAGNRIGAAFLPAVIGISSDLSVGFKAAIDSVNSGLSDMGGSGGFLSTVVAAMGTGDGAIVAQTELYYILRDAVISLVRGGLEPMITATGFVMQEYNAAIVVFGDVAQIIDGVALAFEGAALGVAKLLNIASFGKAFNEDIVRIKGNIDALIDRIAERGVAIQQSKKAEDDWAQWSIKTNAAIEVGLKKVGESHIDVAAIIKRVADMSRAATGQIGAGFEEADAKGEAALKKLEAESERFNKSFADLRYPQLSLAMPALGDIGQGFDELAQGAKNITYELSSAGIATDLFGNAIAVDLQPHVKGMLPDLEEATKKTRTLGDVFSDIPGVLAKAFTGGGGLKGGLKAIGSDLGSTLMSSMFGQPGKDGAAGTGLLKNMTGSMGNMIGKMVPIIGSMIGPAIQGLMKLFGDHAGKDIKKMGKQWGVDLSEGLTEQIKKDAAKFGGELPAMLLNLDKVIGEAGGVAAFGFDKATQKAHDLFSMIQTGKLTVQQAGGTFDKVFSEIAAAGTDSYGRINDKVKELIALNKQFGTESKAVAAFLQGQGQNLIGGVVEVVGAATPYVELKKAVTDAQAAVDALNKDGKQGSEEWQTASKALAKALAEQTKAGVDAGGELADLGTQALAAFSVAVAAGVPWADALKQISPALTTLQDDYKALGLSVDDVGLKTLLTQNAMATAAPQLMSGLSGLTSEITALNNLSAMTPETFAAIERTGARMYTQLQAEATKAGGTNRDALLPIQQYLHQAEDAAKQYGFALDEGTQAMIDQSKEAGVWQEEGQSANDIMISGFSAIILALGGEIPKAWQHMADEAKKAADKAAQAAEDEAARAQAALDGIEAPDLNVHVNYDTSGFPEGGGFTGGFNSQPEGSARGSFVRPWGLQYLGAGGLAALLATGAFIPRGTDVIPAMLTPGEGVVNTLGMGNLGVEGLRALNHGESLTSIQSNHDAIDAEQLAAAVQAGMVGNTAPTLVFQAGAFAFSGPMLAEQAYLEEHAVKPIMDGIRRKHLAEFGRLINRARPNA
jgi:hypothetical protein